MSLFRRSSPSFFYNNYRNRSISNPTRRWLYHYITAGLLLSAGGYLGISYQRAKWEAQRYPDAGDCLCTDDLVDFLGYLPFNYCSNTFGQLAEDVSIPSWMHQLLIQAMVRWYGINLTESQQTEFETFQDFYTRMWKPEARPIDTESVFVAPCDGVVLSVQDDIGGDTLVQVKGLTYGTRALLQMAPPPVAEGCRRIAIVVSMRAKDFHHVVAPASLSCHSSVYVPGTLLPTTAAGYHWIPSVLTMNERVVVSGTWNRASPVGADHYRGSKTPVQPLPFAMVLVGSTLSGRIKLHFDQRLHTNFLDPPSYAVHTNYDVAPSISRGAPVGSFYWGSSVVLMADVPQQFEVVKRSGEEVKAGDPLVTLPPPGRS